jgi:hypothetical protein
MGSGAPLTRIESVPAVMRAVIDISRESRKNLQFHGKRWLGNLY